MNSMIAAAIVRSFVGRLVEELPDGFRLPEGRLSRDEVNALRHLSEQAGYFEEPSASSSESVGAVDDFNLRMISQPGPPEESLRLCLDFGTALSKACAIGRDVRETIPLVLGRYCQFDEELAVPSSIFISANGRMFFGGAAETQHRQEIEHGRKRFDNLKRMLSDAEVNQDLDHVTVPQDLDPTCSGLTKGDLLVLYLAWMTELAHRALNDLRQEDGIPVEVSEYELRGIRRRFAIPCFSEVQGTFTEAGAPRAEWAKNALARAVVRAQVVADNLRDEWDSLTTSKAKVVVDSVRNLEQSKMPSVLTRAPSVREPIAAGASIFDEELDEIEEHDETESLMRRYLMVVDAGAGTTDFAVFQVFSAADREKNRYALLSGSVRMSGVAGNAVDGVLWPLVLRRCGIDPATGAPRSDDDFLLIKTDLAARIRAIKEALFNDEDYDVQLQPNTRGKITLVDLLEDTEYIKLAGELRSQCEMILKDLLPEAYARTVRTKGLRVPVYVLLTGGSSKLPMVEAIGEETMNVDGVMFDMKRVRSLPDWINSLSRELSDLVGGKFAQSAVSIGGAAPVLPAELPPLIEPIVPPPAGERKLEKYPTKGV